MERMRSMRDFVDDDEEEKKCSYIHHNIAPSSEIRLQLLQAILEHFVFYRYYYSQ